MMSTNEDSSLPMRDIQETTYRSLKYKETELELSQNETAKQFKGWNRESHPQEEVERSVKVLREMLDLLKRCL